MEDQKQQKWSILSNTSFSPLCPSYSVTSYNIKVSEGFDQGKSSFWVYKVSTLFLFSLLASAFSKEIFSKQPFSFVNLLHQWIFISVQSITSYFWILVLVMYVFILIANTCFQICFSKTSYYFLSRCKDKHFQIR